MPARQAFVPELIPERLIFTAMALSTTSWNLSRILGPALAGFLIAWTAGGDTSSTHGVGIVYFVIASLYFISAITMLMVTKPGKIKRDDEQNAMRDMVDGLKYVWKNPPIFGLILLSIVPFVFGMPINTLLPAFNEDILGGGPDNLGLLMSAMGIGAIIGSLMLAATGNLKNKATWLIATCVGWGAFIIAFGMTEKTLLAALMVGCIGWISAWNMSLNRGLLQMQVEAGMRGRIMSIDMMSHGLMPLGVIPIAFVAEQYSVAIALMVSGAIFMVVVVLLAFVSQSVRRVDENLEPVLE